MICPECDAMDCQIRFDEFLVLATALSITYLDVRTENAEVYCADVTAWARAVLEDALGLEV
jgi:hypothetical protein